MEYKTIEANARLLADLFNERQPHHIFIGDTNHFELVTTMSCISHPHVLGALEALGKIHICVEMGEAAAQDCLKEAVEWNEFNKMPHEQAVSAAHNFSSRITNGHKVKLAFFLLIEYMKRKDLSLKGVDTHFDSIPVEEFERLGDISLQHYERALKIQNGLGTSARNLGWFANSDLKTAWKTALSRTKEDNSPKGTEIRELISLLIALKFLERTTNLDQEILEKRLPYDLKTAERIKQLSGKAGALTIFGDSHTDIPKALGENTLHVSFCPSDDVLTRFGKINDYLNGIRPNYYLNAWEATLVDGEAAQEEIVGMIKPYISLELFK